MGIILSLAVHGVTRTLVVHLPNGAAPAKPAALVIAFHGHFGTGAGEERLSGLDALSDRFGFIAVYPNGIDRGWNDGRSTIRNRTDDLDFVDAMIEDLQHRYAVDRSRIFATGMSNGAMFTQYLGCQRSQSIAAIASVSGLLPADDVAACKPRHDLSVLVIEGTADPIVPYNGGMVRSSRIGGNGGTVLSLAATMQFWATSDGCAPDPLAEILPLIAPPDGTHVTRAQYARCREGAAVESFSIEGGGHAWPGGYAYLPDYIVGKTSTQLDASLTLVQFFLAHPMRANP